MIDEEFLRPSRELMADLTRRIKESEAQAARDIERYGYGDREYAAGGWREHEMSVMPLRRELDAVGKIVSDYYGLQAPAPIIVPL